MNTPLESNNHRILIVDDNHAIHEDIRKILCPAEINPELAKSKALLFGQEEEDSDQIHFEIESAFQGQEGLKKVEEAETSGRPYAMAFVDVRMPPGWDGVETIRRIWAKFPRLQIVICTAYSDYSWEQMIQQIGRSDSLLILKKPFDNIEVLQIAHAMSEKWRLGNEVRSRLQNLDLLVNARTAELQATNEKLRQEIEDRQQLEHALRHSEERFSKAFKASPVPLAIRTLETAKYVDVNAGFIQLSGYAREEVIGRTPEDLEIWENPEENHAMVRKLREEKSLRNVPCFLRTKTKQLRQVLLSAELFDLDGEFFVLTLAQDITDQVALENQLRQAQKMEAVGQLAAGVAHDFNNLLTIIQGHTSLLLDEQPPGSYEAKSLKTIIATSEKAGKLVRQLLAFSRKQIIQMHPVTIQEVLSTIPEMLPRLLGENIAVKVNQPSSAPQINADPGMLEQMLLNCAVNARDAMPHGGTLTISAAVVNVDPSAARRNQDARAGQFLRLSISDTGTGIPPELLSRIFEPFFTTKPVGKGTGLGLAAVYGIAKQHCGWVEVESPPGHGATFHIFIPTCAATPASDTTHTPAPPRPSAKSGRETILVAEDDDDLRGFVVEVLNSQGYKVIYANSGNAALERWKEASEKIDLLLTDLVMPGGITGQQLAASLLSKDPSLRVLYMSGYSPNIAGKDLSWLDGHDFLQKPFDPGTLVKRVHARLNGQVQIVADKSPTPVEQVR
jgi:PAS domain S-box-containing protein